MARVAVCEWAAESAVPAVWLTPLLRDDECLNDIRRSEAPALLVSGSRDWAWSDAAAKLTGKQQLCLGACDHALLTGDWREELRMLKALAEAVSVFAASLTA